MSPPTRRRFLDDGWYLRTVVIDETCSPGDDSNTMSGSP